MGYGHNGRNDTATVSPAVLSVHTDHLCTMYHFPLLFSWCVDLSCIPFSAAVHLVRRPLLYTIFRCCSLGA